MVEGSQAKARDVSKDSRICAAPDGATRYAPNEDALTMTKRKISESVRLRGGPGWDYPCDNPHMIECASSHCQKAGRCRLKEYFEVVRSNGEQRK